MKRMFIILLLIGILLTGNFVTNGWAEEKKDFQLPTLEESWGIEKISAATTISTKTAAKNFFLCWTQNSGGQASTMQDLCLPTGTGSVELLRWDLPKSTDYEVYYWTKDASFKFGPGFYSSSTGATWASYNIRIKQNFGPGFFMFFAQSKLGLSGNRLSPDIFQVNYLNYQVPIMKGLTIGPDSIIKFIEGKSPYYRLGGIAQFKSEDFMVWYRYFPQTNEYPTIAQLWLFGFFRF